MSIIQISITQIFANQIRNRVKNEERRIHFELSTTDHHWNNYWPAPNLTNVIENPKSWGWKCSSCHFLGCAGSGKALTYIGPACWQLLQGFRKLAACWTWTRQKAARPNCEERPCWRQEKSKRKCCGFESRRWQDFFSRRTQFATNFVLHFMNYTLSEAQSLELKERQ